MPKNEKKGPKSLLKIFKRSDSFDTTKKNYTIKSEGGYYEEIMADGNVISRDSVNSRSATNSARNSSNEDNPIPNRNSDSSAGRFKLEKVEESTPKSSLGSEEEQKCSDLNENDLDNPCYYTISASNNKNLFYSKHISENRRQNENNQHRDSDDRKTAKHKPLTAIERSISNGNINLSKIESVTKNKDLLQPKKSIAQLSISSESNEKPQNKTLQIKRRTIAEVIGNIDKPQQNGNLTSAFSNTSMEKISSQEEDKHSEGEHHSARKFNGSGLSLVYGMFLFLLGTFLSLDTYAGRLGDQRLMSTLFFAFLYGVSIFWLVFLYVDIKLYTEQLNKYIQSLFDGKKSLFEHTVPRHDHDHNHKSNKKTKTEGDDGVYMKNLSKIENSSESSHYMALNEFQSAVLNPRLSNLHHTLARRQSLRRSSLVTIEEISDIQHESSANNDDVDDDYKSVETYSEIQENSKKCQFRGYLNDKSASYNLYLRAGIGTFCLITLLQCLIDIVEAFENKFDCAIENYEAVIALLQFLFASAQFLFIFTRGNIVICRYESLSSFFIMHITVTNLIVWTKNILLETMNEYYDEFLIENLAGSSKNKTSTFAATTSTLASFLLKTATIDTVEPDLTVSTTGVIDPNQSTTLIINETIPFTNPITPPLITDAISTILTTLITTTTTMPITSTANLSAWNTLNECYKKDTLKLQSFAITIKPYLYPAAIEFSVICATMFAIMWTRIGSSESKHRQLLTSKNFDDSKPYSPNPSMLIMLDCTKTSRGLFFGLLIFVCTILSTIVFHVYGRSEETQHYAAIISQTTETILLLIALVITIVAYFKIIKYYTKVIPQVNVFDVVLEVLSMVGIYAFGINSLVAIAYSSHDKQQESDSQEHVLKMGAHTNEYASEGEKEFIKTANILAAVSSIIQSTVQTFFILECLRRYAYNKRELVQKPARQLITALLLTNVSLWFYDTLSAKRFDTNALIVQHFGILRWSVINAFSSPLAIFYRFHSSVCLSDIWYGLYYGEIEKPEDDGENSETYSIANHNASLTNV